MKNTATRKSIDLSTPVTMVEVASLVRRNGLSLEEAAQILALPKLALAKLLEPELPEGYVRMDGTIKKRSGDQLVDLARDDEGRVIEPGFNAEGYPAVMSKPVREPSIAILVRLYSMYPKLLPRFDPIEYYESLRAGDAEPFPLRMLSVLFGMDSSASYHWRDGTPPSRRIKQIGMLLNALPRGLEDLKDVAIKEAKARGVNPFKTGSWAKRMTIDGDPMDSSKRYGSRDAVEDRIFDEVMRELEGSGDKS